MCVCKVSPSSLNGHQSLEARHNVLLRGPHKRPTCTWPKFTIPLKLPHYGRLHCENAVWLHDQCRAFDSLSSLRRFFQPKRADWFWSGVLQSYLPILWLHSSLFLFFINNAANSKNEKVNPHHNVENVITRS